MADTPEGELFFVANGSTGCVDYMDEYHVTLTSFGPTPNRVRKYLRQRFVYSLAEVLKVQIPTPLCYFHTKREAVGVRIELGRLGAEVKIELRHGGQDTESYPEVRIPFFRRAE